MRSIWKYISITFLLTFFVQSAFSQNYTDAEIKTVFIYQFGKNIIWDKSDTTKSFKIAVFGNDNTLIPHFKKLAINQTIDKKPIEISWYTELSELIKIKPNIIYVNEEKNFELKSIIKRVQGKNTLVVSDNAQQKKFVMINFTYSSDETINFEINTQTISEQKIQISPKLLLLGGSEIVVRELYEEQENELIEEKEKVKALKEELIKQEELVEDLNIKINQKLIELENHKNEIDLQYDNIVEQKQTLKILQNDIDNQRVLLSNKIQELIQKENDINQKELIIKSQENQVRDGKSILEDLAVEILEKQSKISEQSELLGNQSVRLNKQFNLLVYAGIFLLIIIFLSVLLLKSIKSKQKINSELKYRNNEILSKNKKIQGQANELERHRNELEQTVEERTAELSKAKEKAEESDRLKSAFLANMSHEIRTPMNAIIGFSNLLSNKEYDSKKRKELVSYIIHGSETLLRLINDIIDISKIEAGQLAISKGNYFIHDIFNNLSHLYDGKKGNHNIDIIFLKNKDREIYTDDIRLQQVFINLIDNALKFTESGFIKIGYNIDVVSENQELIFYVKDSGIGLTKEQQVKIFDRFAKLENEREKLYRGAGLGLSISRNIIELLGGKIWVESELNEGSKFYFTIPFIQN